MMRSSRCFRALSGLGILVLLPIGLHGQRDPEPRSRSPRVEFDRWSVGVRLGYQITAQISEGQDELRNTDTNPPTIFTARSEPQKDAWGLGGGAQVNILPRWGVTVDLIPHSIRFKTGTRVDRAQTATRNQQLLSNEFLVTSANHWDIPVMARYYLNGPRQRVRPFVSGGVGMRLVRNASARKEIGDIDGGESEFLDVKASVETDSTMGAIAGLGFELIDDINLKLSVEGRYARWRDKTFAIGLANALRNHVEIVVGLSF